MKLIKILLCAAALAASAFEAQAQYHSDPLLMTNTLVYGGTAASPATSTNFVLSNYPVGANPNVPIPGQGIFEVKEAGQNANYATQPGVAFQLAYTQMSNSAAYTGGQNTNVTIWIQPLLDDYTLQNLSRYVVTNSAMFAVVLQMDPNSTNTIRLATAQCAATNFNGCKYGKLVGMSGIYTNSILIQSLRAGYPQ